MLFTSLEFLFLFFPIVFLVNRILPRCCRNYWLAAASLFFYAWGEPSFLWIMLLSITLNYLFARCIASPHCSERGRRTCLILAVCGNLGLLFVFKYANLFTSVLHAGFSSVPRTSIALPIGISFFTFQAMSYVIDVYRGEEVQKNPVSLALYISLFPQLIAGPIVRYGDVARELRERHATKEDLSEGTFRFVRGFNKKMLLANSMAMVADAAFSASTPSVLFSWLGAFAYAFQIFFDFSGYSEMAIGLGRILGFHFPENFDFPYISKTVTEFWRRWHMTLGTWFRDYLYFPLGGSRVSTRRRLAFNLLLVWGATGFWHGADVTFLLWGVFYGVLIFFEKCVSLPQRVQANRGVGYLCRAGTLLAVLIGWVLFRAEGVGEAWRYFLCMLGLGGNVFLGKDVLFEASEFFVFFVFSCICSMPFFAGVAKRIAKESKRRRSALSALSFSVQLLLFFVSVAMVVTETHNPFIYFNF
ncbi:MAG: MBOAT family protein [Ruminococcaceae bacterium]|nr:MBOAT family protein [Oscillospiraceae bacterium]